MTGRVGIRDVAREAGVSVTTVSHALSGRGKVSLETRDRVERIARDLGYAPNRVATALRRRRTDVLGFVSDEVATTPFAGRMVLGAQDAAALAGKTLMVVNSNRDPAVEARQIEVLRAQQVDGLLYATMFHRVVTAPVAPGTPVVLVNAIDPWAAVTSIAPDEYRLGVDAARLLIDAGHRRIVHLTIHEPYGGRRPQRRIPGHDEGGRAQAAPRDVRVPRMLGPDVPRSIGRCTNTGGDRRPRSSTTSWRWVRIRPRCASAFGCRSSCPSSVSTTSN